MEGCTQRLTGEQDENADRKQDVREGVEARKLLPHTCVGADLVEADVRSQCTKTKTTIRYMAGGEERGDKDQCC